MLPWQNKTVQFVGEGAFSLADLQRSLSVLSIADTLPTPTLHTIGLPNMPARPPPRSPRPAIGIQSQCKDPATQASHPRRRPRMVLYFFKHADPCCTACPAGSPAPVVRRVRSTAACAAPV